MQIESRPQKKSFFSKKSSKIGKFLITSCMFRTLHTKTVHTNILHTNRVRSYKLSVFNI